MTDNIINPIEKDGIEFYVSFDGVESGMSTRGLARFIGISSSSLSKLIKKIETTKCSPDNENTLLQAVPESLKHWCGLNLIPDRLKSDQVINKAKVLNSRFCEAVIYYYAFESTGVTNKVKEKALLSYRKFAQIGLHSWICKITDHDSDVLTLTKFNSVMAKFMKEMEDIKPLAKKYNKLNSSTKQNHPGINMVLDEFAEEDLGLMLEDGTKGFTASMWLKSQGVTLSKSKFQSFCQLLAASYKSGKQKEPPKRKIVVDGISMYNRRVYSNLDIPYLKMALAKTLI